MKGNLKTAVIAGGFFGLFMSLPMGIIVGVLFGLFRSTSMGILFGFYGGVTFGLVSGFLFGLIIYIFMGIQGKKFKKLGMEITKGKKIIKEGGANHFKGVEGVGGWLILTEDEVVFQSHAFNIQNHKMVMPLIEIVEVRAVLTARIIPNGLLITSKGGTIEKFVVHERNTWVQKINDAISSRDRVDIVASD